ERVVGGVRLKLENRAVPDHAHERAGRRESPGICWQAGLIKGIGFAGIHGRGVGREGRSDSRAFYNDIPIPAREGYRGHTGCCFSDQGGQTGREAENVQSSSSDVHWSGSSPRGWQVVQGDPWYFL